MKQGIFYAVGVGAGDPMDMTLRAKAVLEQADIIVTPIPKAGGTSAAYAIAAQAADLSYAERLDILFPMQAHNDYRERLRSGVLQPVCTALDSGRQVAMVTLGDVSFVPVRQRHSRAFARTVSPCKFCRQCIPVKRSKPHWNSSTIWW